jgi:hypothetical protein
MVYSSCMETCTGSSPRETICAGTATLDRTAGARESSCPPPAGAHSELSAGGWMPVTGTRSYRRLGRLLRYSPVVTARPKDRFVIFSDLHVGNGGVNDDFLRNAVLFQSVLKRHYLLRGYTLVLNGDIEELHYFPLDDILTRWQSLYRLFGRFKHETGLIKLAGNHDRDLLHAGRDYPFPVHAAVRLNYDGYDALIFHGHQASVVPDEAHGAIRFFLRRFVKPMGVTNYTVAYNSRRKYVIEKRVYDFARRHRIVAIIGHTHRPLFESLARIDWLKFQIEELCRAYSVAHDGNRPGLASQIKIHAEELQRTLTRDPKNGARSSLYHADPLVPCLFNSGCVIGKRGITAVEVANGRIALVHWFDRRRTQRYFRMNGFKPEQMAGTDYYRVSLKEEDLDYVFTRIALLR